MNSLALLVKSLGDLLVALGGIGSAFVMMLERHWAAFGWVVLFTFLIRWSDIRVQLKRGAWLAALLLYVIVAYTWGVCSPPKYSYFGYVLPSIFEKFLICGTWVGVAFVCGLIQDNWKLAPGEIEITGPPDAAPSGHGGHGHDDHDAHAPAHGHH